MRGILYGWRTRSAGAGWSGYTGVGGSGLVGWTLFVVGPTGVDLRRETCGIGFPVSKVPEMVERIARGIAEAEGIGADAPIYIGMKNAKAWEGRVRQAYAVIEALRAPTEDMVAVLRPRFLGGIRLRRILRIYRRVLDAVVGDGKDTG